MLYSQAVDPTIQAKCSQALTSLPRPYRDIILQRYFAQIPLPVIAEHLGQTLEATMRLHSEALKLVSATAK